MVISVAINFSYTILLGIIPIFFIKKQAFMFCAMPWRSLSVYICLRKKVYNNKRAAPDENGVARLLFGC